MGLPSVGSPFGVCGWFFPPFLSSLFASSKHAPMDLGSYSTHLGLPVWEGRMMQHHGLKEDGLCCRRPLGLRFLLGYLVEGIGESMSSLHMPALRCQSG